MSNNLSKKINSLKSILKEAERYLDDQMKDEYPVPEKKTESMRDLLEWDKKKTGSRKIPAKKKVKKSKDIKKSVSTLRSLINEVTKGIDRGKPRRS